MEKDILLGKISESELFRLLDIKVKSAEKESVVLEMEVTPKVHQYIGIMNGGVSLLLAESAVSIGAVINSDLSSVTPVGIEINANHLRAVSKGKVTVEAKPLYHGRTLSVWQAEIKNEKGKIICISRCTLSLKKGSALAAIK